MAGGDASVGGPWRKGTPTITTSNNTTPTTTSTTRTMENATRDAGRTLGGGGGGGGGPGGGGGGGTGGGGGQQGVLTSSSPRSPTLTNNHRTSPTSTSNAARTPPTTIGTPGSASHPPTTGTRASRRSALPPLPGSALEETLGGRGMVAEVKEGDLPPYPDITGRGKCFSLRDSPIFSVIFSCHSYVRIPILTLHVQVEA